MLELWKPLLKLKNFNCPVIFTELEYTFSDWDYNLHKPVISKDHHPFIIFYDSNENCYYYLKARGAWDGKRQNYKKKHKGEILVRESSSGGLLSKDSYVDCSQIFKCDKKLLESLIDKECLEYKDTDILSKYDQTNILDTLHDCIIQVPPYLSIIEVKFNSNNQTYGKSLYLSDEKLDYYWEIINNMESDTDIDLREFESSKNSEFKQNRIRYQNGIDFCKLFLNEYFPNEIEKFDQIQKSNNNQSISAKDLDQAVNNNNAEMEANSQTKGGQR